MKSTGNKFGVGCMVLFALPFFATGVGMTWWCFRVALEHSAMQSWVETPATITHAELKTTNNDTSTHQAIATYTYDFNGKPYTGKRVGVDSSGDDVGHFQQDAYNELQQHLDQKQPFRCFVNPQQPKEAVLYRELRGVTMIFNLLFASIFGSAGLAIAVAAITGARRAPKIKADVPANMPWTQRADWEAGLIPSNTNTKVLITTLTAVTIYWLISISPLLWKLPTIFAHNSGFWKWTALVLPLVGVLLVTWLAYLKTRARKFGESTLLLASTPGVIGGQLAGVVRIARSVEATDGFRFSLKCLDWVATGNGRAEKTVWEDELLVTEPMRGDGDGTAIPVLFAIPFECSETTRPGQPGSIHWRLYTSARLPGVDYKTNFDVPVFKTPDSRPDFKLNEELAAQVVPAPNRDVVLREVGIAKEDLANGIRLVFRMARNLKQAIGMTIVLVILLAIIWSGLTKGSIVMTIAVGVVTVLMAYNAIDLWFYKSVVEASPNELIIRGGLLGIGRTHVIPVGDIQEFSLKEGMSAGTNVWNHVLVVQKDGKKRAVGRSIPGKLAPLSVIKELTAALKLAPNPNDQK